MAKNSAKNIKNIVVDAALQLAAEKGWQNTGFTDIAALTGLPLFEIHEYFEDRFDILAAYGRLLDSQTLQVIGKPDSNLSPRDRLFDILMERFDILNANREGAIAILHGLRTDPRYAIISLPHLGRSMSWMLEAAGIDTQGPKGAIRIAGLTGIYLKTLWVWRDDASPDMAKTMAELDKNLGHAEQWAGTLGLNRRSQDSEDKTGEKHG